MAGSWWIGMGKQKTHDVLGTVLISYIPRYYIGVQWWPRRPDEWHRASDRPNTLESGYTISAQPSMQGLGHASSAWSSAPGSSPALPPVGPKCPVVCRALVSSLWVNCCHHFPLPSFQTTAESSSMGQTWSQAGVEHPDVGKTLGCESGNLGAMLPTTTDYCHLPFWVSVFLPSSCLLRQALGPLWAGVVFHSVSTAPRKMGLLCTAHNVMNSTKRWCHYQRREIISKSTVNSSLYWFFVVCWIMGLLLGFLN